MCIRDRDRIDWRRRIDRIDWRLEIAEQSDRTYCTMLEVIGNHCIQGHGLLKIQDTQKALHAVNNGWGGCPNSIFIAKLDAATEQTCHISLTLCRLSAYFVVTVMRNRARAMLCHATLGVLLKPKTCRSQKLLPWRLCSFWRKRYVLLWCRGEPEGIVLMTVSTTSM